MVLAVGSWYAVERPFLRLKRVKLGRFRSTESPGDPLEAEAALSHHEPRLSAKPPASPEASSNGAAHHGHEAGSVGLEGEATGS
jgi:hypothetical protein